MSIISALLSAILDSTATHPTMAAPDRHAMAETANPQSDSLFFSLLPVEVRELIYIEFWRASGAGSDGPPESALHQHIYAETAQQTTYNESEPVADDVEGSAKHPSVTWKHVSCVTDPTARDIRYGKHNVSAPRAEERRQWATRLKPQWCRHRNCEVPNSRQQEPSLFLPAMLTCRRMYLECVSSIYANVTFVFIDLNTAGDFLTLHTPSAQPGGGGGGDPIPLRSIEINTPVTELLPDLYYPPDETGAPEHEGSLPVHSSGKLTMDISPWARVCNLLTQQPNLHNLRIWFTDNWPWHVPVNECLLFAKLFDVRVRNRERFSVDVPWLFVEGEVVEAAAPFVVIRAPR